VDNVALPYAESELDFLAAYIIPEETWYILPAHQVAGHAGLLFRPKGFPRRDLYASIGRRGTCCGSRMALLFDGASATFVPSHVGQTPSSAAFDFARWLAHLYVFCKGADDEVGGSRRSNRSGMRMKIKVSRQAA
jgi:hypothetical protein